MRPVVLFVAGALSCASTLAVADDRAVLKSPRPEYPADARQQKVEGCAIVRYVVNPDGSTSQVVVLDAQPSGMFEKASITAVNHWQYAAAGDTSYRVQSFLFQTKSTDTAAADRCALPDNWKNRVMPAS